MNIRDICNSINKIINVARTPAATIPAQLIVCSAVSRPGLSPSLVASNIIRRQSESGAPIGGKVAEAMEVIRVEEIYKGIMRDGRVQIGIPVGGITFAGTANTIGGPAPVTGFNVNPVHGDGFMS